MLALRREGQRAEASRGPMRELLGCRPCLGTIPSTEPPTRAQEDVGADWVNYSSCAPRRLDMRAGIGYSVGALAGAGERDDYHSATTRTQRTHPDRQRLACRR